jgi:hypothetical protein
MRRAAAGRRSSPTASDKPASFLRRPDRQDRARRARSAARLGDDHQAGEDHQHERAARLRPTRAPRRAPRRRNSGSCSGPLCASRSRWRRHRLRCRNASSARSICSSAAPSAPMRWSRTRSRWRTEQMNGQAMKHGAPLAWRSVAGHPGRRAFYWIDSGHKGPDVNDAQHSRLSREELPE